VTPNLAAMASLPGPSSASFLNASNLSALSVLMGRLEWRLYGDDLQNQRAQLSIALLSRGRR
jgi:hypothetical protein